MIACDAKAINVDTPAVIAARAMVVTNFSSILMIPKNFSAFTSESRINSWVTYSYLLINFSRYSNDYSIGTYWYFSSL